MTNRGNLLEDMSPELILELLESDIEEDRNAAMEVQWVYLLDFLDSYSLNTDCEDESLEFIALAINSIISNENPSQANSLFRYPKGRGRPRNFRRDFEIARQVLSSLRDGVYFTLDKAYKAIGLERSISPEAIKSSYEKGRNLAQNFEHYKAPNSPGRPRRRIR